MTTKAEDYRLVCSALMGTPYIAKVSKKDKNCMLDDRREIPENELYAFLFSWAGSWIDNNLEKDENIIKITHPDGRILEIKLTQGEPHDKNK